MRRLKRANADLKRANAILKAASAFFAAKLEGTGLWYQSPHSGVAISTWSVLRPVSDPQPGKSPDTPGRFNRTSCPRRNVTNFVGGLTRPWHRWPEVKRPRFLAASMRVAAGGHAN